MNATTENLDIIILGKDSDKLKELKHVLYTLSLPHALLCFARTSQLDTYLEKKQRKAIVFLPMAGSLNARLAAVISKLRHYPQMSIAVYDCTGLLSNVEDVFAMGANIYIHKPVDRTDLTKAVRQVMRINAQFYSGHLNRETYFLSA